MPASNSLSTGFAPAERAPLEELRRQIDFFSRQHFTRHLLDALPGILSVLNHHRQIVYANQALLELIGAREEDLLFGLRFGEALNCIRVPAEGGCGTDGTCSTCGAVLATLASLSNQRAIRECRVTRCLDGQMQALDLSICATPLEFREEHFTIFALTDVSHEKRRSTLERIFFHDVLNVAGSIKGFAELLRDHETFGKEEIFVLIHEAAERIIEEIEAQRMLVLAENDELQAASEIIGSRLLLGQVADLYRPHEAARGRNLKVDPAAEDLLFVSDRVLLARVLGNMVKNGLEASGKGDTVRLGCRKAGQSVEFWVHNPSAIPREVQWQIFQRSYSTKGRGRGLGTYSMKLLAERYLQGEVSFASAEEEGTIFRVKIPLQLC